MGGLDMAAERPSAARQAVTIAATGLALVAQQLTVRDPYAPSGWILLTLAAVVAAAAAGSLPVSAGRCTAPPSQRTWGLWRVLCAVTAVAAVLAATYLSGANRWPVFALALWTLSFAAATLAARHWTISPSTRSSAPWSAREVTIGAVVLLLAAVARLAWIGSLPRYYFPDESRVAMFLLQAYERAVPNFFTMGWNTWSVLGLSVQGLFAPLLGVETTTLRLSSALMGTLAVGATYWIARELFTPRVALLSAVLLAICRTAIDFSRLGICHAQVMFLEPLAFGCWWCAINTGRATSYLWAGIGLGLCLYTYNAGQLAPVLWLTWVALSIAAAPSMLRSHWKGCTLTLIGFAIATIPWWYYVTDHFAFADNWSEWTGIVRRRQVIGDALDAWRTSGWSAATEVLSRQTMLTWLGFTVLPAGAYQLGYRGGGMLDGVMAPLFLIGLAMSQLNRRGCFVLYWCVLTAVVGSVLTENPPAVVRMVGLLPAMAILAALPLDWLLRSGQGANRRTLASGTIVALLVVGASWDNWRTYFVAFPQAPIDLASELARRVERMPPNTTVFLSGSEYTWHPEGWDLNQLVFQQELFRVDFRRQRLLDVAEPAHLLPLHEPLEFPFALVLGPTQLLQTRYVQALYPHVRLTDVSRRQLAFRICELTPEDVIARTGLALTGGDGDDAAPRVADPFDSETPYSPATQRLKWEGRIYWPTDRPARLDVQADMPVAMQVAELAVMAPDGPRSVRRTLELPRGWNAFVLEEEVSERRALAMSIEYGGTTHPLTRWDLRPDATVEGLLAVYERDGRVIMRTIDPQLNSFADERLFPPPNEQPIQMPFSVSWRGALRAPRAGAYVFEVQGSGPFSVHLDGKLLVDSPLGASAQRRIASATRTLTAGEHPLAVRWDCTRCSDRWRRVFQVYWTPPGGQKELIPPPAFSPLAPSLGPGSETTSE
jgi:4-amino-4-deoxy-L-arabinose transferase-like glycosyltransferase